MVKRTWVTAPAVVLALALLTAACGRSASGTDGVATASGAGKNSDDKADKDDKDKQRDPQQAGLDYARCMREHGVDVPDPQADAGGLIKIGPGAAGGVSEGAPLTPPAGFEEADQACRHYLEDLIQEGGGPIDPKEQDRALKFAQCMREHGVNMPDPDFSKGGISIRIGGEGFDPNSQVFKDAQRACGEFFGPAAGEGAGPAPARSQGARS